MMCAPLSTSGGPPAPCVQVAAAPSLVPTSEVEHSAPSASGMSGASTEGGFLCEQDETHEVTRVLELDQPNVAEDADD